MKYLNLLQKNKKNLKTLSKRFSVRFDLHLFDIFAFITNKNILIY
jgi:hypothetical protein